MYVFATNVYTYEYNPRILFRVCVCYATAKNLLLHFSSLSVSLSLSFPDVGEVAEVEHVCHFSQTYFYILK